MKDTGYGPEKWAELGYAAEFAKAWDSKVRDVDTLYTISLNVRGRVMNIIN